MCKKKKKAINYYLKENNNCPINSVTNYNKGNIVNVLLKKISVLNAYENTVIMQKYHGKRLRNIEKKNYLMQLRVPYLC